MSRKPQTDSVVVTDRCSRRQFMRAGAGFLLVGGAVVAHRQAQAADCDRGRQQSQSATDQDAGESADPKGCQSKNIISQHQPERTGGVKVARIKAG
ncbi:MAG: hypothetical protein HKN42_19470 [Granulosicoccus sp.]|nr:hypothetical protein [Granulosicoccus sp.]